jgi:hypothetical protein
MSPEPAGSTSPAHLGEPHLARSGLGWTVAAHPDAIWWTRQTDQQRFIRVRMPDAPPLDLRAVGLRPDGGLVDCGDHVFAPGRSWRVDPDRQRFLGHRIVEQHGTRWRVLDGPEPRLPMGARLGSVRPWPDQPGWVWADGDCLYRCTPNHRVSVCVRIPGEIQAFDVGPGGAVWCVGAGCLWVAAPGRFGRRAPPSVVAGLGVPLAELTVGSIVFSDDGSTLAAADQDDGHQILLVPRPTLGPHIGAVTGLSPKPSLFPQSDDSACVLANGDGVVRASQHGLEWWTGRGCERSLPLDLPAPPLAMGGSWSTTITVLTAKGLVGVRQDGTSAPPSPDDLSSRAPSIGVQSTPHGPVWWTATGWVVPLRWAEAGSLLDCD